MSNNKPKVTNQIDMLLEHLLMHEKVTTIYCREELSIMHPAARVSFLRKEGWPIGMNLFFQIDSCGSKHKAGQYYLQVEKMSPEQLQIQNNVLQDLN